MSRELLYSYTIRLLEALRVTPIC